MPVVGSLDEAMALEPTVLLIGVAPAGGKLPPAWKARHPGGDRPGLDVESGLHDFLSDDPELAAAAAAGVELRDLRRSPAAWTSPPATT